jgi:4'-phosphopantetheinyl transferase
VPADVAHVAIARVADVLAEAPRDAIAWLSVSERERLDGMRLEARRAQFVAGHWLTRVLLAEAFGRDPAEWRLLERRSLPPQAVDREDTHVSISHSGDWIAAAVATVPIGIDLEQRPRALSAAIEPFIRNHDEAPGSLDPDSLLQRWVAKEAWIKRDAGSALPARLAGIRLRATEREHADIAVDGHAAFHFAMTLAPNCGVQMNCDVPPMGGLAFAVVEDAQAFADARI